MLKRQMTWELWLENQGCRGYDAFIDCQPANFWRHRSRSTLTLEHAYFGTLDPALGRI